MEFYKNVSILFLLFYRPHQQNPLTKFFALIFARTCSDIHTYNINPYIILLIRCENADKNSTADALLQHPYMYSYNDTGIAHLPKYSDDLPIQEEKSFLESFPKYNKSRILSEFTEIMKIGNGAFGDVIKVCATFHFHFIHIYYKHHFRSVTI